MSQKNVLEYWAWLMTVRQAADLKGVSVQAIYQAIKAGKVTAEKVGNTTLIYYDTPFKKYLMSRKGGKGNRKARWPRAAPRDQKRIY